MVCCVNSSIDIGKIGAILVKKISKIAYFALDFLTVLPHLQIFAVVKLKFYRGLVNLPSVKKIL